MSNATQEVQKTLNDLVVERIQAKREDAAAERRKVIDAQIAALLPKPDDKSTASKKIPELSIKATVTYGTNISVDNEALKAAAETLSGDVMRAFRYKYEVDGEGWNALSHDDKVIAARFVTRKPATPSVKLEVI